MTTNPSEPFIVEVQRVTNGYIVKVYPKPKPDQSWKPDPTEIYVTEDHYGLSRIFNTIYASKPSASRAHVKDTFIAAAPPAKVEVIPAPFEPINLNQPSEEF